jgi:hypothetical protein
MFLEFILVTWHEYQFSRRLFLERFLCLSKYLTYLRSEYILRLFFISVSSAHNNKIDAFELGAE